MRYVVTFYTKATVPVQEFYKTKKEAIRVMSKEVKAVSKDYKGSGYKKKGSISSGRVTFEHPYYGVDYLVKIEKNS